MFNTYQQVKILIVMGEISRSESAAEICDKVIAGISCFPWNGGNCSVHDIVILLSDAWLSDFHIDFTLQKISYNYSDHYGAETSNQHILLPVFDINSIVSAHMDHQEHGHAASKSKYLLEVENKIILGQIDSIGGVLHLPNH